MDELDPETAKTKLAKALKEVPLMKPNQLERPSITELFFSKMTEEENELEGLANIGQSLTKQKGQLFG